MKWNPFSAVGNEEDESEMKVDPERQRLVQMYEEKIEELIKQHDSELSDEKRCNNNRVEALLERLSIANSRYSEIMPDYEQVSDTSTTSSSLFHLFDNLTKFNFSWSDDWNLTTT